LTVAVLVVTLPASATTYTVVADETLIRLISGLTAVVPFVPVDSVTPK
jgi:hypothetical protein